MSRKRIIAEVILFQCFVCFVYAIIENEVQISEKEQKLIKKEGWKRKYERI